MENQIFDWTNWDELESGDMQFYDCTLLVDVGTFKVGDKISTITWMSSLARMEFYVADATQDPVASFKLFVRAEALD